MLQGGWGSVCRAVPSVRTSTHAPGAMGSSQGRESEGPIESGVILGYWGFIEGHVKILRSY